MFALLRQRHFYPVFWVQFLGAFNDNLYKNALVMLITFRLSESPSETGLLITLAAGLFILPFFLFSSLAGQIADFYPKHRLTQKLKLTEVLVMLVGALALMSGDLLLLFFTLFLMGAQSAFFGPIKYSILPEILNKKDLVKGNALFSGSTFIAILLGTIFGGLGVLMENGTTIMSGVVIAVAVLGYVFSLAMQPTAQDEKSSSIMLINWNVFTSTAQMVKQSSTHKIAFTSVLAISWFWFIGAVLLAQIPGLVKYNLLADDNVVIVFLTLFSVGIAIGSGLIGKIMHKAIHIRWHWLMLSMMSVLLWLTVFSIQHTEFGYSQTGQIVSRETLFSFTEFITVWPASSSMLSLGLLALVGGMYIVPLYTLLQIHTPYQVRARMVAVNNIMNSLLMVISAVLLMIGFALSLSLLDMLLILAIANVLVALLLFKKRYIANG